MIRSHASAAAAGAISRSDPGVRIWTTSVSSPTASSLLIYVVANRESSVLRFMRSFKVPGNWIS